MITKAQRKKLIYHIVCVVFLLGSVLCSVFIFKGVFLRTTDGFIDIGTSAAYYAMNLISTFAGENPIEATVIRIPENATSLLPWTWEEFAEKIQQFGALLINPENVQSFIMTVSDVLLLTSMAITFIFPAILLLFLIALIYGNNINNDYNEDTRPLKAFKWVAAHTYHPVKVWATSLVSFIKTRKYYWGTGLLLWLYNLNFITIILEAVAYVIYFVAAFDVVHIYTQIAKLFMDLQIFFTHVPTWLLVLMGIKIFDMLRIRAAKAGRNAREKSNAEFIKGLAIICLVIGTTGAKKTTLMSDISLTKEVEFREQALMAIEANQLKFPDFPWIMFEKGIERAEKRRDVYNWATCKRFVALIKIALDPSETQKPYKKDARRRLWKRYKVKFQYTVSKSGRKVNFNNSLYLEKLFEVLEAYAQEYYLYRHKTSIITGNIPIRSRIKWKDDGNFPVMDGDFFERDAAKIRQKGESQYSHIIDYDWFRATKLLKENNPNAGAFEFGVVDFDEWAKERGNKNTNAEYDLKSGKANPKNDGTNLDLKTRRQSALVENNVYIFFIGTEQRADSLNADTLDLCDILDIGTGFKFSIGIPHYHLEPLLNELFQKIYTKWHIHYRQKHGNNTLAAHIISSIYRIWWHWYLGRMNEYGYFKGSFKRKLAGPDGEIVEATYFLQAKKVFSKTFSSACFSSYYNEKAVKSKVGLSDISTYEGVEATLKEFEAQGSYYLDKLITLIKERK